MKSIDIEKKIKSHDSQLADIAISVSQFGIIDNVDDTFVLQTAINYCAANKLKLSLSTGRTYNVTTLNIKDNLVLEGNGATLKCIGDGVDHTIGADIGVLVQNVKLSNINVDANGKSVNGISFKGLRCIIDNVYVYGMTNPAISYYGIRIRSGSNEVTVKNSTVELSMDDPWGTFSGLSGIASTGTSVDSDGGLKTSPVEQPAIDVNRRVKIIDCVVRGGTHGIGLIASERCQVKRCDVSYSSHRCIVVSQNSSHNIIKNNDVSYFGSSGIHVNACSHYNTIDSNNIYNDGSYKPLTFGGGGGEAGLQCYLKCHYNKFINNVVYTRSSNYCFYSFNNCNGLILNNNTFDGGFYSVIGIESDVLPRPLLSSQPYSRPNFDPVSTMNPNMISWDNGDGFSNIAITNNRIDRPIQDGRANCGIYIAQVGTSILQNVIIDNNTINSNDPSGHDVYVSVVDKAKFLNSMITNNKATPTEDYRIYFDDIGLIDYSENSWQKVARGLSAVATNIDFSLGDVIYVNNGASVISTHTKSIIANGCYRKVYVRLAIGAKLVHNVNTFRLKDSATIIGVTGNEVIELICMSGVFIQV